MKVETKAEKLCKHRYLLAEWPAPANVHALVTTRVSGNSLPPYGYFNLALHVEDNEDRVAENRKLLMEDWGLSQSIQWLNQEHGAEVVNASNDGKERTADAVIVTEPNLAGAVLTADCLPVFVTDLSGSKVAVIHAGWRGMAEGVIENTVHILEEAPEQLMVWLGPAISQQAYEVGEEVMEAFVGHQDANHCFRPSERKGHWYADLYELARLRLYSLGIEAVYGGNLCTFNQPEYFYSYRRENKTGRMASVIWFS
ncbi:peptidoglycan editing factor PgeF [Zooshikella sp. RANM57]|uniref:peptidoglycan editing factor PgeF n=1 Tax=Zooshikella sp. RANM57 TaxID=3425863 RepID=UPI003D6DE983